MSLREEFEKFAVMDWYLRVTALALLGLAALAAVVARWASSLDTATILAACGVVLVASVLAAAWLGRQAE